MTAPDRPTPPAPSSSSPHPPTEATREHWDSLADSYDQAKSRNDVYYSTLKQCFDQAVPAEHRGRVLEVGCGTGQVLASLNPRQGIGVDLSQRMIDMARKQFADRPELVFLAADGSALPGLGQFDAVICADVMEHVENWPGVVGTIVSACRPGGTIVISTPNPLWTFPLWVLERVNLKMPEGPHRFVWSRSLSRELQGRGCRVHQAATRLLLPVHLAGMGPRLSQVAQKLPLLNRCGVIQVIVARRDEA